MEQSSEQTNAIRDHIMRAAPSEAGAVLARDQVVEKWCRDNGKAKDALTVPDIIAIRALPEWIAAG